MYWYYFTCICGSFHQNKPEFGARLIIGGTATDYGIAWLKQHSPVVRRIKYTNSYRMQFTAFILGFVPLHFQRKHTHTKDNRILFCVKLCGLEGLKKYVVWNEKTTYRVRHSSLFGFTSGTWNSRYGESRR